MNKMVILLATLALSSLGFAGRADDVLQIIPENKNPIVATTSAPETKPQQDITPAGTKPQKQTTPVGTKPQPQITSTSIAQPSLLTPNTQKQPAIKNRPTKKHIVKRHFVKKTFSEETPQTPKKPLYPTITQLPKLAHQRIPKKSSTESVIINLRLSMAIRRRLKREQVLCRIPILLQIIQNDLAKVIANARCMPYKN